MIHLLTNEEAAKNLEAAFALDENLKGNIVVLKDHLEHGPLTPDEDEANHDELRTAFWQPLSLHHVPHPIDDRLQILQCIDTAIAEEEPVCFWMAPNAHDVCAYYWLLSFFRKHEDMLHVIQINGLPFLNEKGQLFYPKSFSEVLPKEFGKTKRLLKRVTPAEFEVDGDEWKRLLAENAWVRLHEGGKKLLTRDAAYFDNLILSCIGNDFQKAQKIVTEAVKKALPHSLHPLFAEWRLRQLVEQGELIVQGDATRSLREYELRKPGSPTVDETSESADTKA